MGINEVWPRLLRAFLCVRVRWTSIPVQMKPLASASSVFHLCRISLVIFVFLSCPPEPVCFFKSMSVISLSA